MKRLVVLGLLAACEQPRTEMMFGVVTDIRAPGLIDGARLVVTRSQDGFVQQDITWELSGVPNQPFNLPGSYGVYSDGDELKIDVVLTGLKGDDVVVTRRAVMNLVNEKTLFFRMSLTAGCSDRTDCLATQSCVENVCRDVNIDSRQLPDFEPELVDHLTCDSGSKFIDTGTGAALPLAEGAEDCPASLCLEGTCLKPPPAPESGTRSVSGYKFTTYVEPLRTTNVPSDLTAASVSALVPQTDGTFLQISGRGNSDGSFVIDRVPNGKYYLRVGTQYFHTAANSFDLTTPYTGRPDVVPATAPTTITLQSVTNLSPWGPDDDLEVLAPGADQWWFVLQSFYPITPSATQLTNYSFTNQDANGSSAPNLIRNDQAGIMQLQGKTDAQSGVVYKALTKFAVLPAFTQINGGTSMLGSVAMQDVPQTSMANASFPTSQWDQAVGYTGTNLTAFNPQAVPFPGYDFFDLVVHGQVGGPLFGQFSATADYMYAPIPHGPDVVLSNLTFGIQTLPGLWATMVDVRSSAHVRHTLPGTITPAAIRVFLSQTTLLSAVTPDWFAPNFGVVRAPTIDGRDLFQPQSQGLTTTPRIAWQVPDRGKPVQYAINFYELTASGTTTVSTVIASLTTTETSVIVPPGILRVGGSYAVRITASTAPNPEAPFRDRFPSSESAIGSAMFVPTMDGATIGTGSGSGSGDPGLDAGVPPPILIDAF